MKSFNHSIQCYKTSWYCRLEILVKRDGLQFLHPCLEDDHNPWTIGATPG